MSSRRIRKARLRDVPEIHRLVGHYAKQGLMLARPLSELYENLRDFFVAEVDSRVVGCAAMHLLWEDLAEVKSLAVEQGHTGTGLGRELVLMCIQEAKSLEVKRLLALTFVPEFFQKFGFSLVGKETLPHKIWAECINCVLFPDCNEQAVVLRLEQEET